MDDFSNNRPRVAGHRIAIAAAVGVGLPVGAAGIAGAASTPPAPPKSGTSAQVPPPPPPGPGRRHRGHRPGLGLGLRGALHGEFVVPDGTGYKTVDVQRGKVTDVSATSLTVVSKDGVSKTYVLTPTTVIRAGRGATGKLKVHDQVGVLATVTGDTVTATHVRDLTQLRASHPGPPPPAGAPGPGAAPSDYELGDA